MLIHSLSRTLCNWVVFVVTAIAFALGVSHQARADTVQHVHLSTFDAGFALVAPAPSDTVAVAMVNISERFGYAYGVENLNAQASMNGFDGSFYCAHRAQHAASSHDFYAGSQTGSTCGGVFLQSFDNVVDYAGSSGHHENAAFTLDQCAPWNPGLYPGDLDQWRRFRVLADGTKVHVLKYAPQFAEMWTFAGAQAWPAATNSLLTSSLDFDLVYVKAGL